MIWHSNDIESVINELGTNITTGLSSSVAEERLNKINTKIKEKEKSNSFLRYAFKELKSTNYYILYAIVAISIIFHFVFGVSNLFTPVILLVLAIIKAFAIAFIRALLNKNIKSLEINTISKIKVLRDSEVKEIFSNLLVPGDIIYIEEGNLVPVDARLIRESNLHCDEFAVTNETVPTGKDATVVLDDISEIPERKNMIYAGSHVLSGSGIAVVTEILDYTEVYKNTKLSENEHDASLNIEAKLSGLNKLISVSSAAVFALVFIISTISQLVAGNFAQHPFLNSVITSLLLVASLSAAFLMSSQKIITKSAISFGINRMKNLGILISNTKTIEKIANLQVICADKTGTFTQSKMQLTKLYSGGHMSSVTTDAIDGEHKMLLRLATLCCDGEVEIVRGVSIRRGDATQTAIIAASMEHLGLGKYELDNIYPRMASIPFNAERKLMTSVNVIDGINYVIVRGSVDKLVDKCTNDCTDYINTAEEMRRGGLRTLGVAIKQIGEISADITPEALESGLNFIGLLGLADIPRLDSKEAVKTAKKAGIKIVMITGDSKTTALSTARKLLITDSEECVMTGEEVTTLNDEQLYEVIGTKDVFAEVTADVRARIVKAFKDNGYTVAITGDNAVNTQSLRLSDVGYSMGKSGSDTAISESEVVIKNDSFASVIDSVRCARGIYRKITNAIKFFFSSSASIIFSTLLGSVIFGTHTFTAAEILLLVLVSIFGTSIAMANEKTEPSDIFNKINSDYGIFNLKFIIDVAFNAGIYTIIAIASYLIAFRVNISPSTFSFITMMLCFILSGIALRQEVISLKDLHKNKILTILSGATLVLLIVLTVLQVGALAAINFKYWLLSILIAVFATLIIAAIRAVRSNRS